MATAAISDFRTNGNNAVVDWSRLIKFCTIVANYCKK